MGDKKVIKLPRVEKDCEICHGSYSGTACSKYCVKCRHLPLKRSFFKKPITKNIQNTLDIYCQHDFPTDSHKVKKDTLVFTCAICGGVMELRKKPYTKQGDY